MGRRTLLIVDDMEINRQMLSLILEEEYDILEADNGISAQEVLRERADEISLILLDIVMPDMDGFSLMKYIMVHEPYKKIPVIFVTTETYEENILEGVRMGVRDVIAKPYNPELILRRVKNLIMLSEQEKAGSVSRTRDRRVSQTADIALVVDDAYINRVVIVNVLKSSYKIIEAKNGKEALDFIAKRGDEVAVVLLDIIMPVMDGYEFMKTVKSRGLLKGVPVIAITSEDSAQKLKSIAELGICEIIQKPFTPSVVKNRVDYMVKLSRT